jgi:sRNA-binding protein
MTRQNLQAIHRLRPETRTQALDELSGLGTGAPTILTGLPNGVRGKHALHERARAQLTATHRLWQRERAQTLAEKLGEAVNIRYRRRETQHTARRLGMPMPQQTFELNDAALARLQEFP